MAVNVRRLVCNVTVKSTAKKSPLHKDAKSKHPDLKFREAGSHQSGEGSPPPSETATEGKGPASGNAPVSASGADPHRVADKVYDLMKQEVRLGRMRSG